MNEKMIEKLKSLLKEEQWGRIEPKDIGVSKFKILNDLFNSLVSENMLQESSELSKEHLSQHQDSIIASYIVGCSGYHLNRIEDTAYLRKMIDTFVSAGKWAVTEILAEKILEYGENRVALKALATSLEKLGRNKEATPVWENLLKIDRFDTFVAKKLALAIIDEDPEKSAQYMKLSIEGSIKNGEFDKINELWNKFISISNDDIAFFERIERMFIDARQEDSAAVLLKSLIQKYRDEENPDQSIDLLKKLLHYTPDDINARKDLIKHYEKKYGSHSQYAQFLKLSKLNVYKYPAKFAIHDFEKNIVFDKGNYVYHRSWGVGKINDINSDSIVIDFLDKKEHKMSIQMALGSLTPVGKDHLNAIKYEDPGMLKALFTEDIIQFLEILLKSYNGKVTLPDIKKELIPDFVEQKNWSKWWNSIRSTIKKNPHFGISPKDEFYLREKPVNLAEEMLNNFIKADGFGQKLDIALEFTNNIDAAEGASVVQFFIDYYNDQLKTGSQTKAILSYFIISGFAKFVDSKKLKLETVKEKIITTIKNSNELPLVSIKISSYDYKKDFINLIEQSREDWAQVVSEILFETPVRIHKYIFNNLLRAHAYKNINTFIERAIISAKQNPEIFLWAAKNILNNAWHFDWLDYSKERLVLTYFRLLNELKKIESKGNRLKNMAIDALYDDDAAILKDIVESCNIQFIGKIYDLLRSISYIEEQKVEKFYAIIKAKHQDFSASSSTTAEEEWEADIEKLIVTREGIERKQAELNNIVNVEMVTLSKDLAKNSDVSGDVRENVEYNALLEKQTILKLTVNRLDNELKKATVLDVNAISTDKVNIGTKVSFEDKAANEISYYTILGPWDADFEKRVLSYRSPIAKAFLGKSAGDDVNLKLGDDTKVLKIISIEKYIA